MSISLQKQGRGRDSGTPSRHGSGLRRWWYCVALGVVGLVLFGAGQPPTSAPPPAQPPAPQPRNPAGGTGIAPVGGTKVSPAPAQKASPMDTPLRLIHEAQQAYGQVQDYTCLLIKQERVNGRLPPKTVMDMKVRAQPFSVYLRWRQPRSEAGQEVCYVAGKNGGKMRVRPKGVFGTFAGFISLDPNDPRARKTSRRNITEAGIGNMIERFARAWENERRLNLTTQVKVAEYEYNRRRCTRVETIHPSNPNGHFLYYRDVVYFDQKTHLPIRLEFYDWPRQAGDPGQLVEVYSFANMRLNVGLTDDVFDH